MRNIKKPLFIAEVKTESPFGFKSDRSWDDLLAIALEYGDAIAIHTNAKWGGWFGGIATAANAMRRFPQKMIIAKGIHPLDSEIERALGNGANLVTVVGRHPPAHLAPVCIWEPDDLHAITYASDHTQKIMWNARNLTTGKPKRESFDTARWTHKGWLMQASFIATPEDVHPKANAFIVGEHLPTFAETLLTNRTKAKDLETEDNQ